MLHRLRRCRALGLLQPGGPWGLHRAAKDGKDFRLWYLLDEAGGDVNAANKRGWRPIHYAALRGQKPSQ